MLARNEITAELEQQMRTELTQQITDALTYAERVPAKPPVHTMFEEVTAHMDWRLREESAELEAELAKHGPKAPPHG
jgi:TPP-dependent pyruvate/acetoin dehydrogenase alpha subunit